MRQPRGIGPGRRGSCRRAARRSSARSRGPSRCRRRRQPGRGRSGRSARRHARPRRAGFPGPSSDTSMRVRCRCGVGAQQRPRHGREWRIAFATRFASTWCIRSHVDVEHQTAGCGGHAVSRRTCAVASAADAVRARGSRSVLAGNRRAFEGRPCRTRASRGRAAARRGRRAARPAGASLRARSRLGARPRRRGSRAAHAARRSACAARARRSRRGGAATRSTSASSAAIELNARASSPTSSRDVAVTRGVVAAGHRARGGDHLAQREDHPVREQLHHASASERRDRAADEDGESPTRSPIQPDDHGRPRPRRR